MGRKDNSAPIARVDAKELRQQVRQDIRDRYSVGQRWLCLEEAVKSEDWRRSQFYENKERQNTRELPLIITKFIRTLKRSVRLTMNRVGGTPFSIVRQMFLHWDSDHTGQLNINSLTRCVKSLGVEMAHGDLLEVLKFYSKGGDHMSYVGLLEDIKKDEPGLLCAFQPPEKEDHGDDVRFLMFEDTFANRPKCVDPFLQALRGVILGRLRVEGGTPESHLRSAFSRADSSYSNTLGVVDFQNAMTKIMGLAMTKEQSRVIVKFYDRNRKNEVDFKILLNDVCDGMPGLMTHEEFVIQDLNKNKNIDHTTLQNPFIQKPFCARPNKALEKIKEKIKLAIHSKVLSDGGTFKSWIKDAFMTWDPRYTGKISDWAHVQGAIRRLNGTILSEDEAKTLMHSYDKESTGEMHYMLIIDDLIEHENDAHPFTSAPPTAFATLNPRSKPVVPTNVSWSAPLQAQFMNTAEVSVTGRAPQHVTACIDKFVRVVDAYSRKTHGHVESRDVLLGSFMRYDHSSSGRVKKEHVRKVCDILRIRGISDRDLSELVLWFDTNGSSTLDYHELARQIFGRKASSDISVLTRKMPEIAQQKNDNDKVKVTQLFGKLKMSGSSGLETLETDKTLHVKRQNTAVMETPHQKRAKELAYRRDMLSYRADVVNRLKSVDAQRQALQHRLNKNDPTNFKPQTR